jgi:raffinose/stachyose/melibiose transport system permease protein
MLLNPIWNYAPLASIGLEALSQPWLGRESSALTAISLVSSWQWVGIPMMLFVVGLQNINEDLFEAARIDGASSWQTFFRIKLPLLKPVIGIVSILTFVGNFNAFDIIVTMSDRNGFPGGAADVMGVMLFRVGISGRHPVGIPDPGMGAAIASITLIFLTVVTLIVLKNTRTKE